MSNSRSRGWCVTINNYTADDIVNFESCDCEYKCYELEKGDEKNTPHIQGYLYYKNAVRFCTVKKRFPTAHLEPAKGDANSNVKYCSKDDNGTFKEFGKRPRAGNRTDIECVKEMVKAGKRMRDVIEEVSSYQAVRYAETLQKYRKVDSGVRNVTVNWFYGESGAGKSKTAFSDAGDDYWSSSNDLKWFDGYDRHKVVIFDELRCEDVNFNFLLKLLDVYPLRVPVKGGFVDWVPEVIYVTSQYDPLSFCGVFAKERSEQLIRRITNLRKFSKRVSDTEEGASITPDLCVSVSGKSTSAKST